VKTGQCTSAGEVGRKKGAFFSYNADWPPLLVMGHDRISMVFKKLARQEVLGVQLSFLFIVLVYVDTLGYCTAEELPYLASSDMARHKIYLFSKLCTGAVAGALLQDALLMHCVCA
jgi:hypothetical protein